MSEIEAVAIITAIGVCGVCMLTWLVLAQGKRKSSLDAWRQHRRSVKPLVTQPLLCRMIGHRWTKTKKTKVGDMSAIEVLVFGCCLRCGAPGPREMLIGSYHWVEYRAIRDDPLTPDIDPLGLAQDSDAPKHQPGQ